MQQHYVGGLTAAEVLGLDAIGDAIYRVDPIGRLLPSVPGSVRGLATGRIVETLQERLAEIDLGAVTVGAWSRIREVHAAAERTRVNPTASEDVTLLDHEATSEHHPTLTIWLDGQPVGTLIFDVTFTLTIIGLATVVRGGWLVGLRSGEVTASGRLSWQGHDLLRSPAVTVWAGSVVPLGAGVPLVRTDAAPSH